MKRFRALWHSGLIQLLLMLLYPAAATNSTEVPVSSSPTPAVIVSRPPESLKVRYGEQFELVCKVTGNMVPTWTFNDNDETLPANVHVLELNGGLQVIETTEDNVGIYTCHAGEDDAAATNITLAGDPPNLAPIELDEMTLVEGAELRLPECAAASGHPKPTAEWTGRTYNPVVVENVTAQA
jgi:hypothetical protein